MCLGVYAAAVVKKRHYWPTDVPDDEINGKMKERTIGENGVMTRKLDGKTYNLFMMKEPKYVMKMISTYGVL